MNMDTNDLLKSGSEENVGEDLTTQQNIELVEETTDANETIPSEENNETEVSKNELPNYSIMEKHELKERLVLLLDEEMTPEAQQKIKAIKLCFYSKLNSEIEQEKEAFLSAGGVEEDFVSKPNEIDNDIKALLKQFKILRQEQHKNEEQEKEENLEKKNQIIEHLKNLINREESLHQTFHEFNELQKQWKEIGAVPKSAVKDMWKNYHHHVENFYDYVSINRELRDLDFKKNKAAKIKLCERAEELENHKDVVQAFKKLQLLHESWRELGPVHRDEREELWERFKKATTIINIKHQEHFENLKANQKQNLEVKQSLCDRAEAIAEQDFTTHDMWTKHTQEVIDLQKEWRNSGFVPYRLCNKIYKQFKAACDEFFNKKRKFYEEHKSDLKKNLAEREALCEIAESLQYSEDWNTTTQKLIELQKQWKKAKPVHRRQLDKLWHRFKTACDNFFDRKTEHFNDNSSSQVENLELKKELIERIKSQAITDNNDKNIEIIRGLQKEWAAIGHVPFKQKDKIQNDYRIAIDALYDKMKMDKNNKELQKFKDKINALLTADNSEDKIIVERNRITSKIRQMESDIALWENNIGFFSSASSENSKILNDIQRKIKKGKEHLYMLTEKLNVIDQLVS